MHGSPFKYFAYGVAASEVEVDGFTGAYRLRRVDIVHDVGDSLSPLVDLGQVEGGFVQGAGWLTLEDLRWDTSDRPSRGRLATQAASTYKLPSFSEMPEDFRVTLLEQATEDGVVYGSKAVGEPPLMLGFSVREALREAVAAFGPAGHCVDLGCPSTPEQVFWAVEAARAAARTPVRGGWEADDALDHGGRRAAPRAAARRAGHGDDRPRARPARGRREDGGRSAAVLGHDRRGQPRGDRGAAGPRAAGVAGLRTGDRDDQPHRAGACAVRGAVLRRRGDAAVRAAAPGAGRRDLRDGARRHRAGPDPGPPRPRAAPGGLAGRAGRPAAARGGHRGRPGPGAPPPRGGAGAGARRAARRQPRPDHDPRPRRGRRAVRRGAAVRAPGLDRADRVVGEVATVREEARGGGPRARDARPDHHADRPAGDHREGPGDDRGGCGGGPADAVRTGSPERRGQQDRAEQVVS